MNGRRNIHRSRKDRTFLPILLSVLLILFALIVASLFISLSLSGRKEKGIVEIECLGKKFDSSLEQSLSSKYDETKENEEVLEVLTKGYTYYDRVLRHASVIINKNENNEIDENTQEEKKGND